MLAKQYRLRGKTVHFLLRRRQVFHGRWFSFWYVKQYPHVPHAQWGFFVPKAIHKSAAKRNGVRRIMYDLVDMLDLASSRHQVRVFVRPNKRVEDQWKGLLASGSKKVIKPSIEMWFGDDSKKFLAFVQRAGKVVKNRQNRQRG